MANGDNLSDGYTARNGRRRGAVQSWRLPKIVPREHGDPACAPSDLSPSPDRIDGWWIVPVTMLGMAFWVTLACLALPD